mgnify:CR=1 FL=1|tara:strand:- start:268 stop:441 length:174 start_codon:yes stop_codon:yes gene_type:complete
MNKQELQSRLDLLYSERQDIESQIEFSSSQKMVESLEEELYNINDSIKILKQAGNNG